MILIRSADNPLPPGFEPRKHLIVEYHSEGGGMSFPLGTAYVTAFPDVAWLDFLFVIDPFRRHGIGTGLVMACVRQWPHIRLGSPEVSLPAGFIAHVRSILRRDEAQWSPRCGCEARRYPEWS